MQSSLDRIRNFYSKLHLESSLLGREERRVGLEGRGGEGSLGPQVGGQEAVGVGNSNEGSLEGVLQGSGGTGRRGVDILDTTELQKLLDSRGGNNGRTSGGGDESNVDGSTLSGGLGGDGVRLTKRRTPVSSSDGDDGELGNDDGGSDGGGNLLGGLDTETDVTVGVTNDNDSLESGSLTGSGLLLDGLDLHDLILENGQELVNNLVLLDGESVQVDLLHGLDVTGLDKSTKLGDGNPSLLLVLSASASATSATASSATVTSTTAKSTSGSSCFSRHF
jgi:hypothetical protein